MTAEEIRNPSPSNRLVGFPYTKSMNSNWDLDLAAALIVCSAEAATAAGVPTDRWVFPHAGTRRVATPDFVSNRGDLHSSPAIRVAGRRAMELADVGVDEIDYVDLYSCFPSAVQISATELGLGLDRELTLTGGLTFAGGPLNNYVTPLHRHDGQHAARQPRQRRAVLGERRLSHQARVRRLLHHAAR